MKIILVIYLLAFFGSSFAQFKSIEGKIYEGNTNNPLQGSVIKLNYNNLSTTSDITGSFMFFDIPEGRFELTTSYIGYKTKSTSVEVLKNTSVYHNIYLEDNHLTISEIEVSENREYGKTNFSGLELKLHPVNTAQDLLRIVPGLFIAQHAGGGKAEQLYLRGFDLDHGTDINISVDGMPVNMVSHAHGQGYADLHFVIPETIEGFDVFKGPYSAKFGDLATSGSVAFFTKNSINKNLVQLETGLFNTYRGLAMINLLGKDLKIFNGLKESAYISGEYNTTDGYFDNKQKFNRVNVFGKYYGLLNNNTILSLTASHFSSHWDASGQVPQRAIDDGTISRYGAIDPSEGGNTSRTNINLNLLNSFSSKVDFKNQFYFTNYDFNLYSDFTFFLNDPVNGDEINQNENRNIYGYSSILTFKNRIGKSDFKTDFSIGTRIDDINRIYLAHTVQRSFLNYIVNGSIVEKNIYGFIEQTITIGNLIINPALRFDYFDFNFSDALNNNEVSSKSDNILSPKINLYYNVSSKTQLYIKTGSGFHSNDARVAALSLQEKTLPRAVGYEIGASFSAGNAYVNASIWGLNLESEFVYVGDEGVVEPSGKTRRLGIDFSGRYQFTKNLWADLDLNYAKGKFLDEPNGMDNIPLAPEFTSIGGLSFNSNTGIAGSLRYRYIGDRPANEDNTTRAKGYFLLDAVLNYTFSKITLGVSVENLLNNKNWNEAQFDTESRLFNESEPVTELHFTPGTPLSLKGKLIFNF
ncbi:MAG: TonB-dependent receptor [Ignavibacteria bacterium]|nr:TonB-dependent receptor [Ignavibacteria bacterium]